MTGTTKNERIAELEQKTAQLEQSLYLTQQFVKQLMQSITAMGKDMQMMTKFQSALNYKIDSTTLWVCPDCDIALTRQELDRIAQELQIGDFNKLSGDEDARSNVIPVETVESVDDIVILSSVTPDVTPDQGILRSRMRVGDMTAWDMDKQLIGKKVWEQFDAMVNDVKHTFTLLGVRRPK